MAEHTTIARPYAEALLQVGAQPGAAVLLDVLLQEVEALATAARNEQLQHYADNPQVSSAQIFDLLISLFNQPFSEVTQNFLRLLLDNGRLRVLPAIAVQLRLIVNAKTGISDAQVYSAFELSQEQLTELTQVLEKRFNRKLRLTVTLATELIGGVRVVVGDEVLDTSIRHRLEKMKMSLTA